MSGVRSGQSVKPDVMTSVPTPFSFGLTGPAEVNVDAVVTQ